MSELFPRWLDGVKSAAPAGEERDLVAHEPEAAARSAAEAPVDAVGEVAVDVEVEAPVDAVGEVAEESFSARRPVKPMADKLLLDAVSIARDAIAEVADPNHIGAHLGAVMEGQRLATHSFTCTAKAYRGWHWVAVLARAPRSKKVTVCETALLPGDEALVPPRWVPWEERLQPDDLGARDVLPKVDEDPNLQPSFEQVPLEDDEDVDQVPNFEFGLGRKRVLSPVGLANAAERWNASDAGPEGEYAKRATAHCSSCGYLLPMAGTLRTQFGVCANEWSPFDGRVVSLDAGCGAHSETDVHKQSPDAGQPAIDDLHDAIEVSAGS
ncbi:DUF3027 domain-containing protein [Brevibacterium daeguense]|uniref:DUF3027 domain-containing protein n=1 Tax=Brevibacterium daeguense TaxID=909936 RepID=A0ABP8EGI4_9MICO|nr:DUF3027 domain-containing protein [Brevibacterium daeguense]